MIIDGTALIFRAYHGGARLRGADGVEIGALRALIQRLVTWLQRARSRHFALVFDAPGPSFRVAIDPSYKAHREAPPADLPAQLERAVEVCAALGFFVRRAPGFEADDLMASLATEARAEGLATWLVTPDKDAYQLVSDAAPAVAVYQADRRKVIDAAAVRERFGVGPEAAADFQALVGDPSDGVAGVRGVGPKAAAALLNAFGDLDAIYARLDEVPSLSLRGAAGIAKRLAAGREAALLARRLVVLDRGVPLDLDAPLVEAARWRGPEPRAEAIARPLHLAGALRALNTLARQR